jgi:hypothetical protein
MGRKMGGRNSAGYRTKDEDGCTLEEVGQELGLTRERIRQIEKAALAKVRAGLEAKGITEELWLDHLRDLHKRQKTHFTVSTGYVSAGRFRSVDEAEEAASCNVATAE